MWISCFVVVYSLWWCDTAFCTWIKFLSLSPVNTEIGDHLRVYHPGQLSLLPSAGWVCNQPQIWLLLAIVHVYKSYSLPGQLSLLPSVGWKWVPAKGQWQCCLAGKVTIALVMHLRLMPMTHLPETRAGIQRRKVALDSSAAFWRELQQSLR